MLKPVTFPLYLDRIEEEIAVLLVGDEGEPEIHLPIKYLPVGIKEGHWLMGQFTPDPSRDAATKNQNQDLMADLLSASETLPTPGTKPEVKTEGKPDVK